MNEPRLVLGSIAISGPNDLVANRAQFLTLQLADVRLVGHLHANLRRGDATARGSSNWR